MKRSLSAALVLCLLFAAPGLAASKKPGKSSGKPRTVPSTSPMIVVPPPPAITGDHPPQLISSEMSGKDLQFFTTAVDAGRMQAYLIELLKTKAESPQIKALGNALSSTQDEENKQIAKLAAAKGWEVSTEPTAAQKAIGAELEKEMGVNFDKAAMDRVVAACGRTVSAYEMAAQSTDPDIQSFAGQMLPLVKQKLRLVEKMTGAGKAAAQLFRTATPKPGEPPAITPPAPKSE